MKNVSIIKDSNGMNKIGINQNEEPYKYAYMPELIDAYPPNNGVKSSLALVNHIINFIIILIFQLNFLIVYKWY